MNKKGNPIENPGVAIAVERQFGSAFSALVYQSELSNGLRLRANEKSKANR